MAERTYAGLLQEHLALETKYGVLEGRLPSTQCILQPAQLCLPEPQHVLLATGLDV